jgi:ubiquitin carboxyl-terminal hydrolase 8
MEPNNKKIIGIQNSLNNCYLNSVVQLLCNIPELQSLNYNDDGVYKNFLDTYEEMYDTGNNIIDNENMLDISSLKKSIVSCHSIYKGDHQQDVHEILNIILHHVHEGNSRGINYINSNTEKTIIGYPVRKIIIYAAKKWYEDLNKEGESVVTTFLQGQIRSRLTCQICWKEKNNFEIFRDLSLPIEKDFDLYDCIKNFCSTERMEGENKIFCEKCKAKTYHLKKISLWKIPKYLLIHFKKFNSNMEKINVNIKFPLSNLKILTDTSTKKKKYCLKGIIYHHGNRCFFGHYTCMINYCNRWYHINDETIERVDEKDIPIKDAYVLLYKAL